MRTKKEVLQLAENYKNTVAKLMNQNDMKNNIDGLFVPLSVAKETRLHPELFALLNELKKDKIFTPVPEDCVHHNLSYMELYLPWCNFEKDIYFSNAYRNELLNED